MAPEMFKKALESVNPANWFRKIKQFFKTKSKSVRERFKSAWESFSEKVRKLFGLKKKAGEKADKAAKGAVSESCKDFEGALGLEEGVEPEDKEAFEVALAFMKKSGSEAGVSHEKNAVETLNALAEDEDSYDDLDIETTSSLTAVSLMTLNELKAKYKGGELVKYLTKLKRASKNSKYSLYKLLTENAFKLFKQNSDLKIQKLLKKLCIPSTKREEALELFKALRDDKLTDEQLSELTKIFRKYIFKSASHSEAKKMIKFIRKLLRGGAAKLKPKQLAKFIELVDTDDFDNLSRVLIDKTGDAEAPDDSDDD
jgi:hypothetical protein